jgi:uncharacterized protein (TIGR03086 family)
MRSALAGAVELLDRSLAYTRTALAAVTPDRLDAPTPCADWDLDALLAHMDDALDAFTEAATGSVALVPTTGVPRLASIRDKACALLGWWCEHPPSSVAVGGAALPADLLVGAAALEITVHGWDVHQSLGHDEPLPEELARVLLPLARLLVGAEDRPCRFAPPVTPAPSATASEQLLGFLGRV